MRAARHAIWFLILCDEVDVILDEDNDAEALRRRARRLLRLVPFKKLFPEAHRAMKPPKLPREEPVEFYPGGEE